MDSTSIPSALAAGPFRIAEAKAFGITAGQLRAGLWIPTRGVRTTTPPVSLVERAHAFAKSAPEAFAFSHVTAAQLLGLPLSYAMEEDPRLHLMTPTEWGRMRRAKVCAHRGLEGRTIVDVDGLPVVAAADTWVDLGELVGRGKPAGLDDLIVAGDAAANIYGSTAPLRSAIEARCRPRGKVTLTFGLQYVRVGSLSAMETRSRLMVVRSGLPEPEPNVHLYDHDGEWLAWGDLVWKEQRVVGEYNGVEFHSTEAQKAHDLTREERVTQGDWTFVPIVNDDVFKTHERNAKLRELAVALGQDPEGLRLSDAEPQFFAPQQFRRRRRRAG